MTRLTCAATTPDGDRCRISSGICPDPECQRCLWHCPHRAPEAHAARVKGGERTSKVRTVTPDDAPPPPRSLDDITTWGAWTTHAVACGRIDARTAREIGYNLAVLARALAARDYERRLKELEQVAAALKREHAK